MARYLGGHLLRSIKARDRHQVVDVLVAAGFGVAGEVETLVGVPSRPVLIVAAAPAGILLGGVMLLRRKRPLLAMTLFTAMALLSSFVQALAVPAGTEPANQVVPIFAILVLSYSLGAFGRGRDLLLGLPQPLAVVTVVDLLFRPGGDSVPGALAFFAVFLTGAPALGGGLIRRRQRLVEMLAAQRRQLEIQRVIQTRTALATTWLRLAERLQEDLVAGLDVLTRQIEAVAEAGDGGRAAVTAIENQARTLLAETRDVVVSLATADSAAPAASDGSRPARLPGIAESGVDPAGVRRVAAVSRRTAGSGFMAWTALAAAAVCAGLLLQVRAAPHVRVPMPVALLGCFAIAAPLAVAWLRPVLMTAATWTAAVLFSAFVTPLGSLFAAISLAFLPPFMVGYLARRRPAVAGLAICCLGGLLCLGGWQGFVRGYSFVFVLCSWLAGFLLAARSRMAEELRLNNTLLAGQREIALRQAVAEERARIARDLHDSIGHHLTIIALQAGAARRTWMAEPAKARGALLTIGRVAAQCSAELRIGFGGADPADNSVAADIAALVGNVRAAGLTVNIRRDDMRPSLPGDTAQTLFRVLQEALTNVLRHAPGATADVTICHDGSQVQLTVANDAGDPSAAWAGSGSHGRHGMRQRVEERGGRFDCGRRADGGFEVRAWFPLPEQP